MNIEDAVMKLAAHLNEPDVFVIRHDGKDIIVDVNFVYRVNDVPKEWEGYQVITGKGRGRISCW
jgi:hypothetical protein